MANGDFDRLRREDEDGSGFFSGFVLGVVVGALLALIFSPWKGEQTRELVAERAGQLRHQATDLVSHVRGDGDAGKPAEANVERESDDKGSGA